MARSLEEMLRALRVVEASAVVFGTLPTGDGDGGAEDDAMIFASGETFAAFSDSRSIAINFHECATLQAAGAKDGRPKFTAKSIPRPS